MVIGNIEGIEGYNKGIRNGSSILSLLPCASVSNGQHCGHCTDCLIQIYANTARQEIASAGAAGEGTRNRLHRRRPFKREFSMQTTKKEEKSERRSPLKESSICKTQTTI